MIEHVDIVECEFHNRGFDTTIIKDTVFVYLNRRKIDICEVQAVIAEVEFPIDDSQITRNRYGEIEIRLGE